MSIETNNETVTEVTAFASVEEAVKEMNKFKSIAKDAIDGRDKVKEKLKTVETTSQEWMKSTQDAAKLLEESKIQLENSQKELKVTKTSHALEKALEKAGVASMATALKLVDLNTIEDVEKTVESLKADHSILFQSVKAPLIVPDVKRAGESVTVGGYLEELKVLQTTKGANQKDFDNLRKKYGR